jgi:branched-chain amino acid transport system substrate-binding protein
LLLTSACTGEPSPARPQATANIGFLAPLTGPAAAVGLDTKRGGELAVDIVNSHHPSIPLPLGPGEGLPRLPNTKIKLLAADTTGPTTRGAGEAERLVSTRHVVALADG